MTSSYLTKPDGSLDRLIKMIRDRGHEVARVTEANGIYYIEARSEYTLRVTNGGTITGKIVDTIPATLSHVHAWLGKEPDQ